jgi:hypothetical protein
LQLRTILQNTSQDQVGDAAEDAVGFDQYMGYGRVNAFAALQATTLDLVDSASMQQEFALINPIQSNELQLYSKGKFDGEYTIIIYTIDGKELSSSVKNLTEGVNALPFDFANGNYILSLKSDSYSKVFKVTKR